MREILFRGKRMDNGEWIEGDLRHWSSEKVGIHSDALRRTLPVFPETVGQYTGLTDKNGKRIFEGDIIDHHVQGDILVNRGVIQWDARCARWSHRLNTMSPELAFFNPDAWEVIGNIYDNPELVEVRNDDVKKAQIPEWISVKDKLPENDSHYLVFASDTCEVVECIYYGDGEWMTKDLENMTDCVTHWMPLPKHPK